MGRNPGIGNRKSWDTGNFVEELIHKSPLPRGMGYHRGWEGSGKQHGRSWWMSSTPRTLAVMRWRGVGRAESQKS